MNKMRIVAVTVGALGLLGAGFGTAEAVSAAFAPGTIHGCITGTNRVLEHVFANPNKGVTCPSGSSSVFWDQVNTAGPHGLDTIAVSTDGTAAPGVGFTVTCPPDHPYVLSGGEDIQDSGATLMANDPLFPGPGGQFPQGWTAQWGFPFPDGVQSAPATVWAICSK